MSELPHDSNQPPNASILPQPDQLVTQPSVLQMALRDPWSMYDQAQAVAQEQGVELDTEAVQRDIEGIRETALREVVAPEAAAQVALMAEAKIAEPIRDEVPQVVHMLDQAHDASEPFARGYKQLIETMPAAKTALRNLNEMLNDTRRPLDPSETRRQVSRLDNFSESYERTSRGARESTETRSYYVAGAHRGVEDIQASVKKATLRLDAEEADLRANPAAANTPEVAEAVGERGGATISEHQASCAKAEQEAKASIEATEQILKQMGIATTEPVNGVRREQRMLDELPRAGGVNDAIQDLRANLSRMQPGDRVAARRITEDVERLRRIVTKVEADTEGLYNETRRTNDGIRRSQQFMRTKANQ